MPKFMPMTAMLLLAGVGGAIAQGNSSPGPVIVQPGPAYSSELNAAGVPALRQRQPRRGDLPTDQADRMSNVDPADAALDRKIRSICRGC